MKQLILPRAIQRVHTRDHGMMTFDRATIDSSGAFMIGELERLDQTLHQPLASVTWSRDIQLREDVSIADEISSFTRSTFAAAGGTSPGGKAWIGADANAITGMQLDIARVPHPLTLWGMELYWTIPELESAQKLGRPVDQQKYTGMQRKYNMDVDEQVYIGDQALDFAGLLNHPSVIATNAPNGNWNAPGTTPKQILADINSLLHRSWLDSAYAYCPTELRLPPEKFGLLSSTLISDAGNISILEFVKKNSICLNLNGRELNIQPLKWLAGRGAAGSDRMLAYTNEQDLVRFPLVPLQRTPLEHRGIQQLVTYFGRIGVVEVVYPETLGYMDGI